jgi:CheY-like chemotaxis protein/anti-sigma regulatory factor (Ser/Thr protein kinase)
VLAAVSAFEDNDDIPPEFRATMQMIQRNVQIEARLIDDLLDMTRVTAGKLQLHLEQVDAHVVIEEAAEICRPDASAKGLSLTLHFHAHLRFVNADPARLRQAFWNLFNNAIKFTPEGGNIEVVATNDRRGRLRIAIADTGVGIAAGDLARIFDPFEQVSPFSRRSGGLGLGLAISKMLIDSFEGKLVAESEGPSQGATFVVELPTLPQPKPEEPLLTAAKRVNGRLRILLVEDDDDTRMVMADLLRSRDYDVRETATIAGAVREAEQAPFDLIVSDLGLPDGSGNDLIRTLQTIRPVKGIAVSGFGMEDDVRRTREAGFAAHLIKPITLHQLCSAIEQVTGRLAS